MQPLLYQKLTFAPSYTSGRKFAGFNGCNCDNDEGDSEGRLVKGQKFLAL